MLQTDTIGTRSLPTARPPTQPAGTLIFILVLMSSVWLIGQETFASSLCFIPVGLLSRVDSGSPKLPITVPLQTCKLGQGS